MVLALHAGHWRRCGWSTRLLVYPCPGLLFVQCSAITVTCPFVVFRSWCPQAVWALGNIAGDSHLHRDYLLEQGEWVCVCACGGWVVAASPWRGFETPVALDFLRVTCRRCCYLVWWTRHDGLFAGCAGQPPSDHPHAQRHLGTVKPVPVLTAQLLHAFVFRWEGGVAVLFPRLLPRLWRVVVSGCCVFVVQWEASARLRSCPCVPASSI